MTNNSFYICEDYYLLIFETKEKAGSAAAMPTTPTGASAAFGVARYWSNKLNSRVTFSNLKEPVFLIRKEEENGFEIWNVIIGERIGWITVHDWMNIKPLLTEKYA